MRLYFLSGLLCLLLIQCRANPIITINADSDSQSMGEKDLELKGEKQEETTGVFKSEANESHEPLENQQTETKDDNNIESQQISASTESNEVALPEVQKGIESSSSMKPKLKKSKKKGRQSSSDDDDDDDDEDDDGDLDLDLGVDDDDDDDDDDDSPAADEEDEDYFGGLFDDLLGGGDDDDDDDDDEDDEPSRPQQPVVAEQPVQAAQPAQPVAQPVAQPAETAAASLSPSEELDAQEQAAGELEEPTGTENADAPVEESVPPEAPQAVENVVEPVVVQPVPANDDDDDDEDDDDDIVGLSDDDDDDDDDDETSDDDDDEDDDDVVGDVSDLIEAKRSRALKIGQTKMPAIYISKYNRFVDNVIGRINRVLGKSYDPVRVKMPNVSQKNAKNKSKQGNGKGKKGQKKNKTRKTNAMKTTRVAGSTDQAENKMAELPIARSANDITSSQERLIESESREPAFVLVTKTGTTDFIKNVTVTTSQLRNTPAQKTKANNNKKRKNTTKSGNNKNKTKQSNNKQPKQKVRATLFGLSTLKRDGDVIVNMMTDHTIVKTNFLLGPLTLRVDREYGSSGRRELKSATATTAEMFGRLNLKVIHGGAATLSSIRVLQPKQVRVDSKDNHDKTREYMWKRSAHIASLVSQKLSSVARSMLTPVKSK